MTLDLQGPLEGSREEHRGGMTRGTSRKNVNISSSHKMLYVFQHSRGIVPILDSNPKDEGALHTRGMCESDTNDPKELRHVSMNTRSLLKLCYIPGLKQRKKNHWSSPFESPVKSKLNLVLFSNLRYNEWCIVEVITSRNEIFIVDVPSFDSVCLTSTTKKKDSFFRGHFLSSLCQYFM